MEELAKEHCCCWHYARAEFRTKVKVLNKKYCWLYPEEKVTQIDSITPSFDHCETPYTKCDWRLEECAHYHLLRVEDQLRRHKDLVEWEMNVQNECIKKMWSYSMRLRYLTDYGVCIKFYPEILSSIKERVLKCKFNKNLEKILRSNCRLKISIGHIEKAFDSLKKRIDLLDYSVDSPFLKGDWYYLRSMPYYLGLLGDLFKYFSIMLFKQRVWANMITWSDTVSIDDYRTLIEPLPDFHENTVLDLDHCECLRPSKPSALEPTIPCKPEKVISLLKHWTDY